MDLDKIRAKRWKTPGDERLLRVEEKARAFAYQYIANGFNPIKAAADVGYTGQPQSLRNTASRLLGRDDVQAILEQEFAKQSMTAQEVLYRLSMHSRGNIGHFLNDKHEIDLTTVDAQEHMYLVEDIQQETIKIGEGVTKTVTKIKLYSAQRALEMMAKHFRLLVDRNENLNVNVDVSKLNDEQLRRLANGEPLPFVLATSGQDGTGIETKAIGPGETGEPADIPGSEPGNTDEPTTGG